MDDGSCVCGHGDDWRGREWALESNPRASFAGSPRSLAALLFRLDQSLAMPPETRVDRGFLNKRRPESLRTGFLLVLPHFPVRLHS